MVKKLLLILFILNSFSAYTQNDLYNKFMNEFQQQDYNKSIETGNEYLRNIQIKDSLYLKLLRYLSFSYYSVGDYTLSIEKYGETLQLTDSLLGRDNYDYVMVSYNLAINYSYAGMYSKCFELMDQVLKYIEDDQTKNSEDYINTATQLASVYSLSGCTDKACDMYEQVFEIVKNNYNQTDSVYMQYINTLAAFYLQNGKYEKAEPFYVNSLKQMEMYYGKQSENYITTLNSLGEFYMYAGMYKKMEDVFREFVDVCLQFYGKNSADYATSLNNLAVALEKQGKNKEAEELYLQCLKVKEKVFKKESDFYALSLSNLAVLYDNMGRYDEAGKLLTQAIDIYKKIYGESNANYAIALSNMASVYSSSGRYERAIELLLKAGEIQIKLYGEKYNGYINTLNSLANLYEQSGNYNLSEETYEKTTNLSKEVLGNTHTDYATTLAGLAHIKIIRGKYVEAEKMLKQAMEIQIKAVGEDHSSYVNCLNSLAGLYSFMGNYALSGDFYEQSRLKYLKIYGDLHPEYSTFLNNYGLFFYESGDYNRAEQILLQSLQIHEYAMGSDHPDKVHILANLSNVMLHKGDYRRAEEYSLESVRITRSKLGETHPLYANSVLSLAVFYYETGNYEKAEKYYLETKEKLKAISGENNVEYITTINNLGALYMAKCTSAENETDATYWALKAEKCFIEVLTKDSLLIGVDHPDFALHLNNMAEFYRNTGQLEKSEQFHLKSIENTIKVFGEDYPPLAVSYHNVALLYTSSEQYDKAIEYCTKSLAIKQKTYGVDNPVCSDVMASLAYVYEKSLKTKEAGEYYEKALTLNYRMLKRNFAFLSEEEKSNYYSMLSHYNDMYAAYVSKVKNENPEALSVLYNNMLVNKGILLRSTGRMRESVLNGNNKALILKYNEWLGYRQQLARLYSLPESERYESVTGLEEKVNAAEKELVMATSSAGDEKEVFNSNWQIVRNSLAEGEAAVEFGHFKHLEDDNTYSDNYYALIIRSGCNHPSMINLFNAAEYNKISDKFKGNAVKYVSDIYSNPELYKMVWQPIEQCLKGINTVYCSPDGLLHKLSFASVKNQDNKYISDIYNLNFVSSTILATSSRQGELFANGKSASIFGGAIFSEGEDPAGGWKYLEGTLNEVKEIQRILAGSKTEVRMFTGKDASEENVKLMDGKNASSIIHIATHGYFYPSSSESTVVKEEESPLIADLAFRGASTAVMTFMNSPNPLMRSGLALAGANNMWTGVKNKGDDGVLTAYEVSNLNLQKTKLVVLSACETGLGDIKGSEGVYGLQRAFKMAGVKYIIMSLWQVPDKETAEFMELFYTNLLKLNNVRMSFNATQKVMREKYDPYFWAAFVLVE